MKKILASLFVATCLLVSFNAYANDDNTGSGSGSGNGSENEGGNGNENGGNTGSGTDVPSGGGPIILQPINPPGINNPDPGNLGGGPRTLSPIDGLCVNGNVELFFYQDLGLVAVTVVNNATGDMWYCTGESRDGVVSLPIDTQRGNYVVTIETEYAGKFVGYFAL